MNNPELNGLTRVFGKRWMLESRRSDTDRRLLVQRRGAPAPAGSLSKRGCRRGLGPGAGPSRTLLIGTQPAGGPPRPVAKRSCSLATSRGELGGRVRSSRAFCLLASKVACRFIALAAALRLARSRADAARMASGITPVVVWWLTWPPYSSGCSRPARPRGAVTPALRSMRVRSVMRVALMRARHTT